MEICLPLMGSPYGCVGGFNAAGTHGGDDWPSDAPWGQAQPPATRKRGWEGMDGPGDERAIRHRADSGVLWGAAAAGGGGSGAVATLQDSQLYGSADGGMQHGQAAEMQHVLHLHHYQQHQMPQAQVQPPPLPLNAFQVLMGAAPMKVDGIVCTGYASLLLFCIITRLSISLALWIQNGN